MVDAEGKEMEFISALSSSGVFEKVELLNEQDQTVPATTTCTSNPQGKSV